VTDSTETGRCALALADAGPMIVATVRLPDCAREQALAAFTDAAVLARWWRGELAADLVPGGQYRVAFPAVPAELAGRVLGYVPGSVLRFSWAWAGEEERPASTVTVSAQPADGPDETVLTIEHGPHADDEAGRAAHAEHWAGWEFFLPRLAAAVAAGVG